MNGHQSTRVICKLGFCCTRLLVRFPPVWCFRAARGFSSQQFLPFAGGASRRSASFEHRALECCLQLMLPKHRLFEPYRGLLIDYLPLFLSFLFPPVYSLTFFPLFFLSPNPSFFFFILTTTPFYSPLPPPSSCSSPLTLCHSSTHK